MRRSAAGRLLAVAVVLAGLAACSAEPSPPVESPGASPTSDRPPSASAPPSAEPSPSGFAPPASVVCPTVTVPVQTAVERRTALAEAQPGAVIGLADGTYPGNFWATARGTADQPIFLCGSAAAVLDAGGIKEEYVLHLEGAAYWRVLGITVRNGQKGVMADAVQHLVLQGITVSTTGDEAIHFRRGSSDNVIRGSTVRDTGHRRAKFGEGIYLGTATSNWCTISDCQPDQSNRNHVLDNTISQTTAESIDVKEGTTDGVIFGNIGAHSPADGFQTHEIVDGAGARNVFADNAGSDLAREDREGVLIGLHPDRATDVRCSNRVTDDSAPRPTEPASPDPSPQKVATDPGSRLAKPPNCRQFRG